MIQKTNHLFTKPNKRTSGDIDNILGSMPTLQTNKSVPLFLAANSPIVDLQKVLTTMTNILETEKQTHKWQCRGCEQLYSLIDILKNQNNNLKKQNSFLLSSIRNQSSQFRDKLGRMEGEVRRSVEKMRVFEQENRFIKRDIGSKMKQLEQKLESIKDQDQKSDRIPSEISETKELVRQPTMTRAQSFYKQSSLASRAKEKQVCSPRSPQPSQKVKQKMLSLQDEFQKLMKFSHQQRIIEMNRKLVKKKMVDVVKQISELQVDAALLGEPERLKQARNLYQL